MKTGEHLQWGCQGFMFKKSDLICIEKLGVRLGLNLLEVQVARRDKDCIVSS